MFDNYEEKMKKSINVLVENYGAIRAGRANPNILDKVMVDYYGTPTPVNQMAAVSVQDARNLVIQPWDISTIHEIEKAIYASDIGINPNSDGKIIRLAFPALTEERRKEIVKDIQKMSEETKVAIRAIRRDANDFIKKQKKDGEITEDDVKDYEKDIQNLTDKYCKEVDSVMQKKEKEIIEI